MSIDILNYELPSLDELQIAIDKQLAAPKKGGLAHFVRMAWHILEPSTPLVWGKVLDLVCDDLENIVFNPRFEPRWLCNIPPGTMKSMLVSVMFPSWVWTFAPEKTFTGVSHEQGLAIRDSRKMRLLVTSEWYQQRWPLKMASDADAKTLFENERRGFRQAVPFRSMTGRRSDFVIVDDPHSAEDANSAAYREEAARIFRETLPTRVNNTSSAILIIMQRLHVADVSGIILEDENKFGYETLILPMRFEKDRADPKDWRKEEGELLFPERFNEQTVSNLERLLREYGSAGQLQQRPTPRDGGMFKRDWFLLWDKPMPNDVMWVRGYDLAASTKTSADKTSSIKMGITADKQIIIADCQDERLSPADIKTRMLNNAQFDGQHVRISIPRDPAAAGLAAVETYRQLLVGYDCRFSPESGDKQLRAMPLAAQAEAGGVFLMKGNWNETFLDEVCNFPNAKHDDIVDASSRAFNELMQMSRPVKNKVATYGGRLVRN